MTRLQSFLLIGLVTFLSACSPTTTDPVRVEQDFGQSVQNMIELQKYDPEAAERTGTDPVIGLDGQKAQDVMSTYHGAESDAANIDKPIELHIEK